MDPFKRFVATLAGTGRMPLAPGSWASLLTVAILWQPAAIYGNTLVLTVVAAASLLTLWTAEACIRRWGEDPPQVVIDECAGQAVPLLFLPLSGVPADDLTLLAAAFLLFRLFDIFKPLGIHRIQHVRSGFGILLDDLLAGSYALICLQLGLAVMSA